MKIIDRKMRQIASPEVLSASLQQIPGEAAEASYYVITKTKN
ncbi:MAG: hypothetical protein V7K89_02030 [Nostoc sp.]